MIRPQPGFTIIELMITIVVGSILMSLAVPAFNDTLRNNRLTTQANALIASMNIARGEAIKRRANVSVCVSTDQASCTGGSWQAGWIVRNDTNGEVLRVFEAMKGSTAVTATNNVATLQYNANGFLTGNAALSFDLCAESGQAGRQITVTATGRPHNVSPYPTCP